MDKNEILLKVLQKENKLLTENFNRLENKYIQLEEKYNLLTKLNEEISNERNLIREQLDSILYSRSYIAIKKIKKILGR